MVNATGSEEKQYNIIGCGWQVLKIRMSAKLKRETEEEIMNNSRLHEKLREVKEMIKTLQTKEQRTIEEISRETESERSKETIHNHRMNNVLSHTYCDSRYNGGGNSSNYRNHGVQSIPAVTSSMSYSTFGSKDTIILLSDSDSDLNDSLDNRSRRKSYDSIRPMPTVSLSPSSPSSCVAKTVINLLTDSESDDSDYSENKRLNHNNDRVKYIPDSSLSLHPISSSCTTKTFIDLLSDSDNDINENDASHEISDTNNNDYDPIDIGHDDDEVLMRDNCNMLNQNCLLPLNNSLRKSEQRTRRQLNQSLQSLNRFGIIAKFGQCVVSSNHRKVSHVTLNDNWNIEPRKIDDTLEWWLGTGTERLRQASLLDPCQYKQPNGGIPIFWAKNKKDSCSSSDDKRLLCQSQRSNGGGGGGGAALCYYIGHYDCISLQKLDTFIMIKTEERQAVLTLQFNHFHDELANQIAKIP